MSEGQKEEGLVTESADVVGLNPAAEERGGSNPSGPTTPYHEWAAEQPESERKVEVGQHRFFAIDGIGMMEGTVTAMDADACWIKSDEHDEPWWVPWNATGMTGVGIIIGGREHQLVMKEAEQEAISAPRED